MDIIAPLITATRDYIAVKIPKNWSGFSSKGKKSTKKEMTEGMFLGIVKRGEKEYRAGKTKVADSIKELLRS